MYRNIFVREFMGTKLRMARLSVIMIMVYVLLSISLSLFLDNKAMNNVADVELRGTNKSSEITYEMYNDIDPIFNFFTEMDDNNDFNIYPVISRTLVTMQVSPLKKVDLTIQAYEDKYLKDHLINKLIEGRLPENSKEIIIGGYFQKHYDLKVGDLLGSTVLQGTSGLSMLFNISLYDNNTFEDYKIVGVISDDDLNFSIVRQYDGNIKPNRMFIYFNNNHSYKKYTEIAELAAEQGLNSLIGGQKDNYIIKKNASLNYIMTTVYISLLFITILMFTIMYIMKGTNRKIGILKALGIQDKVIIKIFANGFYILLTFSMLISVIIVNIIFYFMNKSINNFYGFDVNTYQYSWNIIITKIIYSLICYVMILVLIKLRTLMVTPKECITKI